MLLIRNLIVFFVFTLFANIESLGSILEEKLESIPEIKSFVKIKTPDSFEFAYEIMIEQKIDHENPDQGSFLQKIYLSHRSFQSPTLLYVNGYISFSNNISEWCDVLGSNQIYVEHRYFGDSKPENVDLSTLNLKSASQDLHNIRNLFAKIYRNKWISVGISKGGLTAVAYKYYFPKDVDATIALSTSLKTKKCDTSFFNYIDSLGYRYGCFDDLLKFQKDLLENKNQQMILLDSFLHERGRTATILGIENVFERAVLEVAFSVWQNNTGCEAINGLTYSSNKELFESLLKIHKWFLTDDNIKNIHAYHYQALSELGSYCYPTSNFRKLLKFNESKMSSIFLAEGDKIEYSNNTISTIQEWLLNEGDNIVYISGENDPYSIYRLEPKANVDAISILLSEKNHNQVRLKDLNSNEREIVINKISSWVGKLEGSNY